jgi:AraC-like DNA-binding protein
MPVPACSSPEPGHHRDRAGDADLRRGLPARESGWPARAFDVNVTEVETVFRRTPSIALGKYRCGVDHPRFAGGGPQRCPFIAFPHASVRIVRERGPTLVYTPNTISLHNIGDVYRRSAISVEGEHADWIAIAPSLLRDISCAHGVDPGDRDRFFGIAIAPSEPELYLAQRTLFRALRESPGMDVLEIEEHTLAIVGAVMRGIARRNAARRRNAERRFAGRAPRIVDAAVALLAEQYASTLGIEQIAWQVHCSPSYLARQFRRRTGFSMHEYQQQLRLRASLDMLPEARRDLTGLAVHLGFSSHSHFSSVFRRRFGMTPSEFCKVASASRVREMRARLHAGAGERPSP